MASKKAAAVKAEAAAAKALAAAKTTKTGKGKAARRTPTGGVVLAEIPLEPAGAPETLDGAGGAPVAAEAGDRKYNGFTDENGQRRVSEIVYVKAGDPKSLAVGELHRTRSRSTKSMVIVFRTTDEPVWVDPNDGKYAAVCVEHKALEQYTTRAGAFADWTRAPFCPECVRFTNYGVRVDGDPLAADAAAEPDTGEGDSAPIEDETTSNPPSEAGSEQAGEQSDEIDEALEILDAEANPIDEPETDETGYLALVGNGPDEELPL